MQGRSHSPCGGHKTKTDIICPCNILRTRYIINIIEEQENTMIYKIPPRLTQYLNERWEKWSYVREEDNYIDIKTEKGILSYNINQWRS